MTRPGEIVIVQSAWPPYRQEVVDELIRRLGDRLAIISGDQQFAAGVSQGIAVPSWQRRTATNHFLFERKALWQSDVMRHIVAPRVAILELNPRILNTWSGLAVRRTYGRASILWGHAWPRSGPHSRTERLRRVQRQLSDCLLVYTQNEAQELMQKDDRKPVFAAPNALYLRRAMASDKWQQPNEIVFSGRLVPEKKPQLLLEAFISAQVELGEPLSKRAVLSYIGTGPLSASLKHRAIQAGVSDSVRFHGARWDPAELRRIYDRAFIAVSSGYAGLNVVQASSFGTRIVVADSEPHAPEIAYVNEDVNGRWFRSGSSEDLVRVLLSEWHRRAEARSSAATILHWARVNCSIEVMADGFVAAIDHVAKDRT